ncbi:DUF2284 domain-containing protein [Methermicoccus shengliensis]|uniref:DUF2284 domain-containing protein n=1 Tax=Methermicoccus shengliensis TaxID=660064 RepID=A0A832RWJ5_9EURY|nr:DUF2284 domain-containing protein [Methermicoccus shengliensis]KUK05224.1 MAG: Putative metal-binding protein [Euryarchaeota archaeon 55_53]KUK30843.1 MAG: Putative metal-binding protein [Methanosarcinales archeaon 56_1174]MDI3487811.1 hypothetical protein [Methanosarcinales archaeon]MDN5294542.1 hypothetical protein [Methanosarcinales archaeon]HIH69729.1 DUF2284 domain-containing protein [Methermicoccus shengliensis]
MVGEILSTEELSSIIAELQSLASARGASCHSISARDVEVAEWVRLKCEFGCRGYGKRLGCPPYTPSVEETRRVVASYSHALLVHFKNMPGFESPRDPSAKGWHGKLLRKLSLWVHDTMFELERRAFLLGAYRALAFVAYPCEYCEQCVAMTHEGLDEAALKRRCPHKERVRPSMEACGIDVFATVRRAGLPIHTIGECTPTAMASSLNSYALLLLD